MLLAQINGQIVLAEALQQAGEGIGISADALTAQLEHAVGADVIAPPFSEQAGSTLSKIEFNSDQAKGVIKNLTGVEHGGLSG